MNSLCRYLARDLIIKCDTDIQNCRYGAEGWFLSIENEIEEGPFDLLISTIPAPQNDDLFAKNITLWEALAGVQMRGCSTLMLGFNDPVDIAWEGAIVSNSPIGWIGLDSSKPARPGNTSLVVQSTGDWGDKLLNAETSQIENVLLEELKKISGIDGWVASVSPFNPQVALCWHLKSCGPKIFFGSWQQTSFLWGLVHQRQGGGCLYECGSIGKSTFAIIIEGIR